jgi:hypothetical protein
MSIFFSALTNDRIGYTDIPNLQVLAHRSGARRLIGDRAM